MARKKQLNEKLQYLGGQISEKSAILRAFLIKAQGYREYHKTYNNPPRIEDVDELYYEFKDKAEEYLELLYSWRLEVELDLVRREKEEENGKQED